MVKIEHFKIPCQPALPRGGVPEAKRSVTMLVLPGGRGRFTATLFIDHGFAASYSIVPRELAQLLAWGGGLVRPGVTLRLAVLGGGGGSVVPVPCPPPKPPAKEIAGPMIERAFAVLHEAVGCLFCEEGSTRECCLLLSSSTPNP